MESKRKETDRHSVCTINVDGDVDRLSDRQVKDYRAAFDDRKNSKNEVEYRYLEELLNKLGFKPTETEMEDVYENLDIYCNGSVSFPHFLKLMAGKFHVEDTTGGMKLPPQMDDDLIKEMREAFKVFDMDGNGYISQAELKHTLINMGEKLSEEEIEDMMKEADKDRDGQISFPEFCRMMYPAQ